MRSKGKQFERNSIITKKKGDGFVRFVEVGCLLQWNKAR